MTTNIGSTWGLVHLIVIVITINQKRTRCGKPMVGKGRLFKILAPMADIDLSTTQYSHDLLRPEVYLCSYAFSFYFSHVLRVMNGFGN